MSVNMHWKAKFCVFYFLQCRLSFLMKHLVYTGLALNAIKNKYFNHGFRDHLAEDYEAVGTYYYECFICMDSRQLRIYISCSNTYLYAGRVQYMQIFTVL